MEDTTATLPERDATPGEAFELGRVAGFDEGWAGALKEVLADIDREPTLTIGMLRARLSLATQFVPAHTAAGEGI